MAEPPGSGALGTLIRSTQLSALRGQAGQTRRRPQSSIREISSVRAPAVRHGLTAGADNAAATCRSDRFRANKFRTQHTAQRRTADRTMGPESVALVSRRRLGWHDAAGAPVAIELRIPRVRPQIAEPASSRWGCRSRCMTSRWRAHGIVSSQATPKWLGHCPGSRSAAWPRCARQVVAHGPRAAHAARPR
jgi:hypothetical protein